MLRFHAGPEPRVKRAAPGRLHLRSRALQSPACAPRAAPLPDARRHAQTIHCGSNLRQIGQAMTNYTVELKGAYPPNSIQIRQYWFSGHTLGRYLPTKMTLSDGTLGGGV